MFYGRADARFCCGACRQQAYRERAHEAQFAATRGRAASTRGQAAATRRSAQETCVRARAVREETHETLRKSRATLIACKQPLTDRTGPGR
ncbi:hypothetical protein B2J96_19370 [Mycobacterium shigaense]|nr:hypothetical protein B2J96_19370 [Mycobacterium shigaense]